MERVNDFSQIGNLNGIPKPRTFHRGDIYYIENTNPLTGSEQSKTRPGIIVGNNKQNETSKTIQIVWLTSQYKAKLPTHVNVMGEYPSIALCENVISVSIDRVGDFIKSCTASEMSQIDRALKISLALTDSKESNSQMYTVETIFSDNPLLSDAMALVNDIMEISKSIHTANEIIQQMQNAKEVYLYNEKPIFLNCILNECDQVSIKEFMISKVARNKSALEKELESKIHPQAVEKVAEKAEEPKISEPKAETSLNFGDRDEKIVDLYVNQGMTYAEVAKEVFVSTATVQKVITSKGLSRPKGRAKKETTPSCEYSEQQTA